MAEKPLLCVLSLCGCCKRVEQLTAEVREAFLAGWDAGQENEEAKWMDKPRMSRHIAYAGFIANRGK